MGGKSILDLNAATEVEEFLFENEFERYCKQHWR